MVGPVSPGLGWGYPLLATTRGTGGSPAPAGSAGAGAGSRRSTSGGGEYPVYSDIRREYDCLEEDEELESFLTRVLDRRDQLRPARQGGGGAGGAEECRGAQCSEGGGYSASSVFASSGRPV